MLDIHFDGQQKDEEVVAMFHRSIWVYFKWIVAIIICLMFSIVVLILSNFHTPGLYIAGLLFFAVVYLIVRTWYIWSNNLFIVTNMRVIGLVQNSVFERQLKESYLDSICQVTAVVKGVMPNMFGYGQVLVQTEEVMILEGIETPFDAKHAIFMAIDQSKRANPNLKRD
ncbi:MAG: hypothetical protein WC773_03790 [Patescibacteria group bacterium]|jgi:cytochrome c-type biogenesis protein CcmE